MTDQFRFDGLGCINRWIKTPNLDKLAKAGTLFTRAISNSLECVPARFSLATGLYPHQSGVWENSASTLNPKHSNWMQAVESAGYRTSVFGKTHLHQRGRDLRAALPLMHALGMQKVHETAGPPGNQHALSDMVELWKERGEWATYKAFMKGAAHFHPKPWPLPFELYYDVYVPQQANQFLRDLGRDKPWFCWVSFGGPHPPYDTPEPYASMYARNRIPPPLPPINGAENLRGLAKKAARSPHHSPDLTTSEVAELRAYYAGAITLIDEQIGEIVRTVTERGELEKTLIIFTSDHGEMNGDHNAFGKSTPFDGALRIPLIIVPPNAARKQRGIRNEALVELMDIGATIVDFAGAKLPPRSNALSLRPLLESATRDIRQFAISEYQQHYVMVTSQWKIEFNKHLRPLLLFDRKNDPKEMTDLSENGSMKSIIAETQQCLQDFLSKTPLVQNVTLKRRIAKRAV
jgi:choline-sulfatase